MSVQYLPEFGYRIRGGSKGKVKCKPFTIPRVHHIHKFIGFFFRYFIEWIKHWWRGKALFIDNFNLVQWKPMFGAPIGGIGSGTIGRGYKGEFCRFQMIPGMYQHNIEFADQFLVTIRRYGETVYQKVLCCNNPDSGILSGWSWNFNRRNMWYHALYPRAWYLYSIPEYQLELVCRQISPIIPHNYKDSSFPGAVFVWEIHNECSDDQEVSITFTFKNGQGCKSKEISSTGAFSMPLSAEQRLTRNRSTRSFDVVKGAYIDQTFKGMQCTYCISSKQSDRVRVSMTTEFDPVGDGSEIWNSLYSTGDLNDHIAEKQGTDVGCAVNAKVLVKGHSKGKCEFSLAWHMPNITFGSELQYYERWYHQYFGGNGVAGLVCYSLNNYTSWEQQISSWQAPILQSKSLPAWYKSALFNELYFLSDGGTVWVQDKPLVNSKSMNSSHKNAVIETYGKFAYLEGHEYRMYNTYDVHYYASFALLMLWPKLQLSVQYDIARCILREDSNKVKYCMSGEWADVKAADCVPHDIGDPDDAPWDHLNAYLIHPTQEWKDLNTKFILQVYRDYSYTKDKDYLLHMYPLCKILIEKSLRWDTDGDGIIDNSGFADQTYDAWPVSGASAYCGGLWLSALKVFTNMADYLNHNADKQKFTRVLEKGKQAFEEKLWNGNYYNYDSSTSYCHDSIMADQLAGQWYLKASHIPNNQVFPQSHVLSTLKSIVQKNVLPFDNGQMGAINGMRPNGKKDLSSIQSEEFWTGVNYALAATMIQEGLLEEGFQTAHGTYHTCWERYGLAFQTPEAYFDDGRFRSLGYMRPLAIWAMQYALETFHSHLLKEIH